MGDGGGPYKCAQEFERGHPSYFQVNVLYPCIWQIGNGTTFVTAGSNALTRREHQINLLWVRAANIWLKNNMCSPSECPVRGVLGLLLGGEVASVWYWPPTPLQYQCCMWVELYLHVCNEADLYSVITPLHVSGLLVAHQEAAMYKCDSWCVLYVLVDCRWAWMDLSHLYSAASWWWAIKKVK
jgi:hypothetical protein